MTKKEFIQKVYDGEIIQCHCSDGEQDECTAIVYEGQIFSVANLLNWDESIILSSVPLSIIVMLLDET